MWKVLCGFCEQLKRVLVSGVSLLLQIHCGKVIRQDTFPRSNSQPLFKLPASISLQLMSFRCNVTVLYGESKMQKTILLPVTAIVSTAKKSGSDQILNHLRLQAGVLQDISINQECTDFYPGIIQA